MGSWDDVGLRQTIGGVGFIAEIDDKTSRRADCGRRTHWGGAKARAGAAERRRATGFCILLQTLNYGGGCDWYKGWRGVARPGRGACHSFEHA
jgi:hypothetical protein